MALDETCYDHVRGEQFMTITASEVWSISMVKRLQASHPDEVEIRHTNPDGSMVVRLPSSWMRIVPKRRDTLTAEQRQALSQRMTKVKNKTDKKGEE